MKRLLSILLLLMPVTGFWCACTSEEVDTRSDQASQLRRYLGSTHKPTLLSEEAARTSLDIDPPFYTATGDSVYRYIRNYYTDGRDGRAQVEWGDAVRLTFRMYLFTFENIVDTGRELTMPYYSNDASLEEAYYAAGLSPGGWNFEPLETVVGAGEIINGLERALVGCRERDTVEVYMTYNMAYGDDPLGVIPGESPIAVFFTVDGVTKR